MRLSYVRVELCFCSSVCSVLFTMIMYSFYRRKRHSYFIRSITKAMRKRMEFRMVVSGEGRRGVGNPVVWLTLL